MKQCAMCPTKIDSGDLCPACALELSEITDPNGDNVNVISHAIRATPLMTQACVDTFCALFDAARQEVDRAQLLELRQKWVDAIEELPRESWDLAIGQLAALVDELLETHYLKAPSDD